MYTQQDLVRIAKRENNTKREYLVVNRLQGKHIPVRPHEALFMFQALGDMVKKAAYKEKLLLVGFAETATAIGAAVAAELSADYIQTTREQMEGVSYLYFSEEHSHAAEQKLIKEDMDAALKQAERIIFIEDEVTTGKTILNIMDVIKKQYNRPIKFSVASLLNGMDEKALKTYRELEIDLFWLVKTSHASYTETARSYAGDGDFFTYRGLPDIPCDILHITVGEMADARRMIKGDDYVLFCENLWEEVMGQVDFLGAERILVLGTEEFMYPALMFGKRLEETGKQVWFHATTRSPIAVSKEEDYPLHRRYELDSFYEKGRRTFLYDIHKYDVCVAITDARGNVPEGMASLAAALRQCGNEKIVFVTQGKEEEGKR